MVRVLFLEIYERIQRLTPFFFFQAAESSTVVSNTGNVRLILDALDFHNGL
jgi:hypothetical protein